MWQKKDLWGSDVSADRSAAALAEHVFSAIAGMECGSKLVGQTYDGTSVMSVELNGVQAKVQEQYPCASFVHCCAHVLNLVLSQACSSLKVFFFFPI